MADIQIISEAPINMHQLKKELERIKKRDNELNFRANRTEEYLQQVATVKNADELFSKLMKLNIPRLKEHHIHKIIDIAPTTMNELKVIYQLQLLEIHKKIEEIGLLPQ